MTSLSALSAQRIARVLLTAVSVAYTVLGLFYYQIDPMDGLVATVAMAAVVAVFYVNLRAALRDRRPPYYPLTLVLQALITYVPDSLLPGGWSGVAAPMLAGAVLVYLPLRWAGPIVGLMTAAEALALYGSLGVPVIAGFYAITIPTTGAMVYALVRLSRMAVDLEQARAELTEAAVLKERLRISRDLHDGLGLSLTAIALKGDLASRLLERDPGAAVNEVRELVQVAREAAQDVRGVARGYREMSMRGEVDRAVALLETSGIGCRTHLADAEPPRPSEVALAWAVREAVTNILRHSRATTCTISTSLTEAALRLEVVNDGAPVENGPSGGGLAGIEERARQAGGSATASRTGTDGFRLVVEVPA
jgi:two-component system sensor histidine kinase DesK